MRPCASSAEGDRAYLREERVINTCLFTDRQIHTNIQDRTSTLFTTAFWRWALLLQLFQLIMTLTIGREPNLTFGSYCAIDPNKQ